MDEADLDLPIFLRLQCQDHRHCLAGSPYDRHFDQHTNAWRGSSRTAEGMGHAWPHAGISFTSIVQLLSMGVRLTGEQISMRWSSARTCPVSLIMRHGERFYLRCLKYVSQYAPSVVSPIMR